MKKNNPTLLPTSPKQTVITDKTDSPSGVKKIEVIKDQFGVWVYSDPYQAGIAVQILTLTGWEIAEFDALVNTDSLWANREDERAEFIKLRQRVTDAFKYYLSDNYRIEMEVLLLLAHVKGSALWTEGRKYFEKDSHVKAVNRKNATKPRQARDPLREKVRRLLSLRRDGECTLQEALNDWNGFVNDGLKLTYQTRGMYLVEDLNSIDDDATERTYSLTALKKIWGELKRK